MALITSCPACGTMFRVVPDQLKISEGWVRCGHCSNVFDATVSLRDESALQLLAPDPTGVPTPATDLPTEPGDLETLPAELATRPATLATGSAPLARDDAALPREPETMPAELTTRPVGLATGPGELRPRPTEPAAASSFFGPESESLEPSPLDSPFVFRRSDLAGGVDASVLPPAPQDSGMSADEEPTPAELDEVSFVRQARRKAFWRRPTVRVLLAVLALALAALLALQLGWQDRDRLALAEPELRPALARMCELLHCTLGAPREIESIAIDSSGFNRLRNDTYRLAFTLRNQARLPVAVPAMELTITDAQDQPIARRVLLPVEFGAAANEAIPPMTDWSRAVGVVVATPPATRVAGYRLLAFYP
jgi:predicted Zn finger-like uncharacterized protein